MPDFGIMRGFNEKLFGDKLVAGQLPTQLGLIGSSDFGTDPDAQAFFDRVTAAGGSLSATEQLAIDTLVKQMKLDGIWTKMKAIYPMVGASAAACAQNLKSSSFTGTFNGGWTFASTGATPNGTNGYMDTNLNQASNFASVNMHLSYYTTSGFFENLKGLCGFTGPSNTYLIPYLGNLLYNQVDNNFTGPSTTSLGLGFLLSSRTSTILRTLYYKENSVNTNTGAVVLLANSNYALGAVTGNGYSNFRCSFSSIGDGLDSTEALNFYNAVQTMNTSLSRQV